MGGHYGSIHVRTDDVKAVELAVTKIAREQEMRFLIAPAIDGWVTVFPNGNGQDDSIGGLLAVELADSELIQCLVHDDAFFAYWYFKDGALKDRYNSRPTYFDKENKEPRGGDARILEHLLTERRTVSELQSLLDEAPDAQELNRLDEFGKLLGLPNAGGAYEYIQAKDCGRIKRLREFIHVPDLKDEKARKREPAAQVREEMRRLKKEGVLLADLVGPKSADKRSGKMTPVWTMNPVTGEVLLMWIGGSPQPGNPVWLITAKTPEPQPTDIEVDVKLWGWPIFSKSGQWFLTRNRREIRVHDFNTRTLCASFPLDSDLSSLRFSADEKCLIRSEDKFITVLSIAEKREVGRIEFKERVQNFAVLPDGRYLICNVERMLAVVDLQSLQVMKRVWIKAGGRQYMYKEEWEKVAGGKVSAGELAKDKAPMTEAELADFQRAVGKNLYPSTGAAWIKFSSDGKWLACMSEGLCVVEWSNVMACGEMGALEVRYFVPSEVVAIEAGGISVNYCNTLAAVFDEVGGRVLFSGVEGKVKYLDLATGAWGDLLDPPEPIPLFRMELTPDRSALVVEAIAMNEGGERKMEPERLQMWSYPALCKSAGIAF